MECKLNVIFSLPSSLYVEVFLKWLVLGEVCRLDSALCSHQNRKKLLKILMLPEFVVISEIGYGIDPDYYVDFDWLLMRGIRISWVKLGREGHDLEALLSYLRKFGSCIRRVEICNTSEVSFIAMHCRNLRTLTITRAQLSEDDFRDLLFYNPHLEELNMEFTRMRFIVWKDLSLPNLKHFSDVCGLVDSSFEVASGLGLMLERLSLTLARDLRSAEHVLLFLDPDLCRTLRSLKLHSGYLPDDTVTANGLGENLVDQILLHVARHCTLIVNLDLNHCDNLTDQTLLAVVGSLQHLRTLNIAQCLSLTDRSLEYIAQHCSERLHSLFLHLSPGFSLMAVVELLEKCTQLRTFGCGSADRAIFSADLLCRLMRALRHITTLYLHGGLLTDGSLRALATHCVQLGTLDISVDPPVHATIVQYTAYGLQALTHGCPQLRLLHARDVPGLSQLAGLLWRERCPLLRLAAKTEPGVCFDLPKLPTM